MQKDKLIELVYFHYVSMTGKPPIPMMKPADWSRLKTAKPE